jgi:hypothetical protein
VRCIGQAEAQTNKAAQVGGFELDESKGFVIPFTYDTSDQPLITVRARIGKSKPYTFLVDTGVTVQVAIFGWAQRQLRLPLTGKSIKTVPGDLTAQATGGFDLHLLGKGGENALEAPVSEGEIVDFPDVESWFRERVAGIIGGPVLLQATTRYDFDKKTLTFFTDKHPPLKPHGAYFNVKLFPNEDGSRGRLTLTLPGLHALPFEIDTGSVNTVLPADEGAHLDKLATRSGTTVNVAGTHPTEDALLSYLDIGDTRRNLPVVTLLPGISEPQLGLDQLACFRVTIDPDNRIVTFEPRAGGSYRRIGESGFDGNGPTTDAVAVSQIRDPHVSHAGVDRGDVIVSIDNHLVANMNVTQINNYLSNFEGQVASFVFQKPNKRKITVQLLRRSRFSTVAVGLAGLTILKDNGKTARVLEVEPGSQGERVGIRAEDEILAVNGKPVLDASAKQLYDLIESAMPNCELEVKRKADAAHVLIRMSVQAFQWGFNIPLYAGSADSLDDLSPAALNRERGSRPDLLNGTQVNLHSPCAFDGWRYETTGDPASPV